MMDNFGECKYRGVRDQDENEFDSSERLLELEITPQIANALVTAAGRTKLLDIVFDSNSYQYLHVSNTASE